MNLISQLQQARAKQFSALILDNEVTVGEFVAEPPLPWTRIVQHKGVFQAAKGYPHLLTAEQAKFEMTNWDEVFLPGIIRTVEELGAAVDYCIIGNNAGQGRPLAQAVPQALRATRAAIIYAAGLPQQAVYEQLGYRCYFRRDESVTRLLVLAQRAQRPLALYFMNTIQHNRFNYHDP